MAETVAIDGAWRRTRSQLAIELRRNPDADVTELRRQLKAERLAEYVAKVLHDAPPLTDQQRRAVAHILIGGPS